MDKSVAFRSNRSTRGLCSKESRAVGHCSYIFALPRILLNTLLASLVTRMQLWILQVFDNRFWGGEGRLVRLVELKKMRPAISKSSFKSDISTISICRGGVWRIGADAGNLLKR